MVLEAVMICVDNSDPMINGDYPPSRFKAQNESVFQIARTKIEGNQESVVGVLSLAGKRIQTHCTLTRDMGRIMSSLKDECKVGGDANFVAGLKTAQIALKNRQNKNQHQRIILFAGSPIEIPEKQLVKLGKQLKKNNIAVDVINFGAENAENDNAVKLEAFVNAVNSSDNSHLVNIPPGPHYLADMLMTSPVIVEGAQLGAGGVPSPAGPVGLGDVDPNMDPELAMALRMSMEEARQREGTAGAGAGAGDAMDTVDEDDDLLLQQAIAMSQMVDNEASATPSKPQAMDTDPQPAGGSGGPGDAGAEDLGDEDISEVLQDPDFIASLLDDAGVDKGDVDLDDILRDDKDKNGQGKSS